MVEMDYGNFGVEKKKVSQKYLLKMVKEMVWLSFGMKMAK